MIHNVINDDYDKYNQINSILQSIFIISNHQSGWFNSSRSLFHLRRYGFNVKERHFVGNKVQKTIFEIIDILMKLY